MTVSAHEATSQTKSMGEQAREYFAFDDQRDYDDVGRGLIAELPDGGRITDRDGRVVWDLAELRQSVKSDAPDTVHPSLWRQSQLITVGGLFEVVPGIYQVRNHDIANVTFVETADSVVLIDAGQGIRNSEVARDLYFAHRPRKPIAAIIYTHTHGDHFGGALAFASREDVATGKVAVIAPGLDFDRLALGENVLAGNVMARRAQYFFGELLPTGERGFVSCGIGTAITPAAIGYIAPTDLITETGTRRTFGGITFEFQYTPDTEAPEEMHIWIPEYRALTCAENANHSLHNIQTLRGARTRDASKFAHYLDEALERYGDEAEVHFGPHTWPVWGNAHVREFLESQRDAYKYIYDQALRLANHGYRPIEIAERITFPESLDKAWWNRGYHGTLSHDLKAVFHKELGWFNGNPATLYPHPEKVSAPRYVEAMGGAAAVIDLARTACGDGDYRWAVQLLDHVVTAEPDNAEAKNLQADAYEQLGYQAEGPQWRNAFLTAALELREGARRDVPTAAAGLDMVMGMPIDLLFDYAAIRLNGPAAVEHSARFALNITDLDGPHSFQVRNGVLHYWPKELATPDATITLDHQGLVAIVFQPSTFDKLLASDQITVDGDVEKLRSVLRLFDEFDPQFNIVTPID
ncbi:alkyl/aryl-sulfatase [Nocardia aurea]|uniref:Alkyl sulfatase dimerization domain-containing protein n=1 Tax=Nocardia aurea TaxID=2144174 RepID=A0ABV3G5F8_9NOCA